MSSSPSPSPAVAEDRPWVVCLCAQWCGTCRDYAPVFDAVARAHPALRFAWVDIEDHADIADDFDVETFPTLLIADAQGTRFLGPLLPNAAALARLLAAAQPARPASEAERVLLAAVAREPGSFAVDS